jgi:hypothetical protein
VKKRIVRKKKNMKRGEEKSVKEKLVRREGEREMVKVNERVVIKKQINKKRVKI